MPLHVLGIEPDIYLDVMRLQEELTVPIVRLLLDLDGVLSAEKQDATLAGRFHYRGPYSFCKIAFDMALWKQPFTCIDICRNLASRLRIGAALAFWANEMPATNGVSLMDCLDEIDDPRKPLQRNIA